jgi:hypothetical protein
VRCGAPAAVLRLLRRAAPPRRGDVRRVRRGRPVHRLAFRLAAVPGEPVGRLPRAGLGVAEPHLLLLHGQRLRARQPQLQRAAGRPPDRAVRQALPGRQHSKQ